MNFYSRKCLCVQSFYECTLKPPHMRVVFIVIDDDLLPSNDKTHGIIFSDIFNVYGKAVNLYYSLDFSYKSGLTS